MSALRFVRHVAHRAVITLGYATAAAIAASYVRAGRIG